MNTRDTVIRDDLSVEKIAAKNPRIDAALFREWQKKMALIERVNAMLDSVHYHRHHPVGATEKHLKISRCTLRSVPPVDGREAVLPI